MERGRSRYLRHHKAIGSTGKTITYHRHSIGDLLSFLRGQGHSLQLDDLHADDVLGWLTAQRDRGLSQKTVATRVISVKAWTRWLVEEEWLSMRW